MPWGDCRHYGPGRQALVAPRHGRHVHGRVSHVPRLRREWSTLISKAAARKTIHCALEGNGLLKILASAPSLAKVR